VLQFGATNDENLALRNSVFLSSLRCLAVYMAAASGSVTRMTSLRFGNVSSLKPAFLIARNVEFLA
jgi:hypothetical protein